MLTKDENNMYHFDRYQASLFCSFYKGEKFIESYLQNVLEQSVFFDLEFVFIDCDSPENEQAIIEPYVKKYENIKYYKLDKDPGLYAGWNEAIKRCSAQMFGNWNIDDRKNRDGLEFMLKRFESDDDLDILYGFTYISKTANEKYEDNSFENLYPCLPHSLENLFKNNSPHCMPLWRKNLHDSLGFFDENYKTASDGDFWLRCAIAGAKIKMINHPIGLYFLNPEGRSTDEATLKEMVEEVNLMRQKHLKNLENRK